MNLTNIVLSALAFRAKMFEESAKDPLRMQERTLLKYLARNRNCEYGLKYGFSSIRSISDFRARVPFSDYEGMRPYIDRMKNGGQNILTSDKAVFFGITSGTTGKPKLIPVTKYSRDRKSDLMNLWAYYICRDHPRAFNGKILAIISPEIKNHTECGLPYGPEDGHAYNNLTDMVKSLYVLPYEIFYIEDYDARYYCMLRIAMEQNVSTIATLNPSTIVLLFQRINDFKERIIEDIGSGTLDPGLKIPPDIRKLIEKKLKPDPKRAKELKEILKNKKELLPKYFWPGLELVECWKGGTVKSYLKELPRYIGDVAIRDFGCLSTEARSSVPMSDEGAGGVLAINTNFYEFIPKEDADKKNKRILLCDQLEKGKEYLLIVTTPGGLYRYNMDDIITVDGFFNKTPVIEFVQKGGNAISLTGEKVYESHIDEAVNLAADKQGLMIRFFSSSVQMDNPPRYIFLIEFYDEAPIDKKRKLLISIEEQLRIQNSEYDDTRKQQLLDMPVLKVVRRGDFERYRSYTI